MPLSRRQFTVSLGVGAVASLAAACQAAPPSQPQAPAAAPTATNPLVKPRASGAPLTAVQAGSEIALGRNRFAIGLIDDRNQPVVDGSVNVEFFKLQGSQAEKRAESAAVFRSVGGASKGIWVVAPAQFPELGPWGAQVTL